MQFAARYGFDADAGRRFREQLGLTPSDSKNFVPVDWVAECIVRTMINEMDTETAKANVRHLHWTNPRAVPCEVIQRAISDIVADRYLERVPKASAPSDESEFRELLSIYEAYFRADPVFDNQVANAETPELPCPVVGSDLLIKLGTVAANTNFGWPHPRVCALPHRKFVDALRKMPKQDPALEVGSQTGIEITLLGPGAPEPMTFGESNSRWNLLEGSSRPLCPQSRSVTQLDTLAQCLSGTTGLIDSMTRGLWLTESEDQEQAIENIQNWMSDVQSVGCLH